MVMVAQDVKTFTRRVKDIAQPMGVTPDARTRIVTAYIEGWRTYHNHQHILDMLDIADQLNLDLVVRRELYLLILYHDVWYKIMRTKGENERNSAQWAVADVLGNGVRMTTPFRRLERFLTQGIEATIEHNLNEVDEDFHEVVSLLLDIDLYGLGQSPEQFAIGTEKVWGEFMPAVTREEFDQGRCQWAETFLDRDRIYHHSQFQRLEQQARQNLADLVLR